MSSFCLSLHADYACHHAGACCTAGWPIPVESRLVPALREGLQTGRLTVPGPGAGHPDEVLLQPAGLPAGVGAVLASHAGACGFYERDSGLCAVHRALGPRSLPVSCQHFPRACLIEADRVSVTLSHYCPTVARLAFRADVRPAIVPAPDTLVSGIPLEGLDAREALPPLVRPGLLADREGYRTWERFLVQAFAEAATPEETLRRTGRVTEQLRAWTPGGEGFAERADRVTKNTESQGRGTERLCGMDGRPPASDLRRPPALSPGEAHEIVRAAVPAHIPIDGPPPGLARLDERLVAPAWPGFARPLCNYLAAKAVGNWCAYQGLGLRTVLRSLEIALAVVRAEAARHCGAAGKGLDEALLVEALRSADLLLVHLVDPADLARRLSVVENEERPA